MGRFLVDLVNLLFNIYYMMVFVYILMSWIPNLRQSALGEIIGKLVEPILAPFRKIIPPLGMIDISPIAAFFALQLANSGAKTLIIMIFGY